MENQLNSTLKRSLTSVRTSPYGNATVNYDKIRNQQAYFKSIRNLYFEEDVSSITLENNPNHFYSAFDRRSTQQCNQELYFHEIVVSSLRLELF